MVKKDKFQISFFRLLQRRFKSRGEMIVALEGILCVGRDAVYRRLRGDTFLSAGELITLARHYKIPLDQHSEDAPRIDYPAGMRKINSEIIFFRDLEQQSMLTASLPNISIDYATPELPLFYELYYPTLLAYKTYVYGLTTWNLEKWKGKDFRMELIDPRVYEISNRIVKALYSLPTRELWSIGILDITLRQIEHGVQIGYLNDPALVNTMFEEIEATVSHMEAMTRLGKRFIPGEKPTDDSPDFRVYHNEMTNTNNVIMVNSDVQQIVFTTFVNPNYLVSTDERVCDQMKNWFNNLLESSNVLNMDSAKYTTAYFRRLRRNVSKVKRRIEVISDIF